MTNEIRTIPNGPRRTHYRVVVNYGPAGITSPDDSRVSEFPTGSTFDTLDAAKQFIQADVNKPTRREILRRFKTLVPESARIFRCWSVLEYVPTISA